MVARPAQILDPREVRPESEGPEMAGNYWRLTDSCHRRILPPSQTTARPDNQRVQDHRTEPRRRPWRKSGFRPTNLTMGRTKNDRLVRGLIRVNVTSTRERAKKVKWNSRHRFLFSRPSSVWDGSTLLVLLQLWAVKKN